MRTERQISAGGVVFRKVNDEIEVAPIAVKGGKVWCLPKGLVGRGESLAEAAVREVREETGLEGVIIGKIDSIKYWYAHKDGDETVRYFKIVHFFLMEYKRGDVKDHDWEVDDCRWFHIDEAIERLEYGSEKAILKKAKDMISLKYKIQC